MFVVMYASNGNRIWRAQRGSSGNELAWAMDLDTSNDVYIAGDTSGDLDGQTLVGSEVLVGEGSFGLVYVPCFVRFYGILGCSMACCTEPLRCRICS